MSKNVCIGCGGRTNGKRCWACYKLWSKTAEYSKLVGKNTKEYWAKKENVEKYRKRAKALWASDGMRERMAKTWTKERREKISKLLKERWASGRMDANRVKDPKSPYGHLKCHQMKKIRGMEGCCSKCGSKNRLQIHHKDFNKRNHAIDNLKTLCMSCHMKLHWYYWKMAGSVEAWSSDQKTKMRKIYPSDPDYALLLRTLEDRP